jgi:hypothetical protein
LQKYEFIEALNQFLKDGLLDGAVIFSENSVGEYVKDQYKHKGIEWKLSLIVLD